MHHDDAEESRRLIDAILTLNRAAQKNDSLSLRDKERFQKFALTIDNYRLFGMTSLRIKMNEHLNWLTDMSDISDDIIGSMKEKGEDIEKFAQVIQFFDSVLV